MLFQNSILTKKLICNLPFSKDGTLHRQQYHLLAKDVELLGAFFRCLLPIRFHPGYKLYNKRVIVHKYQKIIFGKKKTFQHFQITNLK